MNIGNHNLIGKAFAISFQAEFIQILGLYYILLIGAPSILSINTSLWLLEIIGGLIFFPILMTALRSYEDNSPFIIPKLSELLKKCGKILFVNLLVGIIVGLGSICFIIPGIIFWKKYIYISVISEKELLGPLDSMKRSNELSKKNGWKVFSREFYLRIVCMLIIFIPYLLGLTRGAPTPLLIVFPILIGWLQYVVINSLLFYGYREALYA